MAHYGGAFAYDAFERFKPILSELHDSLAAHQRLIIVPHGPLHYLPFHALHDREAYLLEKHEISYLPGASLLRYWRVGEGGLAER